MHSKTSLRVLWALCLSLAFLAAGCCEGVDERMLEATGSSALPKALAWHDPAVPKRALQGTWRMGSKTLEVRGDVAKVTYNDGEVRTFPLRFDAPAQVQFQLEEGEISQTLVSHKEDVYLGPGVGGFVRGGTTYVVNDGWHRGTVVFEAETRACTYFGRPFFSVFNRGWDEPVEVSCSLDTQKGATLLRYSYPDHLETRDGAPVMHEKSIEVFGGLLLDERLRGHKLKRLDAE